jgi:hypothetical protein
MIVDINEDIIADEMSRIFYIRKQLRLIKKEKYEELPFVIKKTIETLETQLQKSRSNFCEELENKIEKKKRFI